MNLYESASQVGATIGVPPEIIYAQWQHESADGAEPAASFNFGGVKEWEDTGKVYHDFASMEEWTEYMSRLLPKFGVAGVQTTEDYVAALKANGYMEADETAYLDSMKNWMSQNDAEGTAPPPQGILNFDLVSPNTTDQSVTNTDNLRPETIFGANLLGDYMTKNHGIPLSLTGGAEVGYHAKSASGHGHEDGWKIDVGGESIVAGTEAGDAFKAYCNEQGWSCNWEENHWDVDFSGSDSRDKQTGFTGNLFNTMMGAIGDKVTNYMYSGQHDAQTVDYHADDYSQSASFWEKASTGFMDGFTSTGTAYVAQALWGNLFHSSNHIGALSDVSQDDLDYVKNALPGNADAQKFCLLNGRDSEEIKWLVKQKLVDERRRAEIAKWNDGCTLTIANAARLGGSILDPTMLIPIGTAFNGARAVARLGSSVMDVAKVAQIATRGAQMGGQLSAIITADNILKERFGGQKPEYGWDAAMAFVGGTALGVVGGLWRNLGKKPTSQAIAEAADHAETRAIAHSMDIDIPRVRNETHADALKIHDTAFGKTVSSPYYSKLEANGRVIASTYEDARKLISKASGIEIPARAKAAYVPNEDYTILIKDNVAPKELDAVLAHEFSVHAGLQKAVGDKAYTKIMKQVDAEAAKDGTIFNVARQRAGSYDPEEILARAVEDNLLPQGFMSKLKGRLNIGLKTNGIDSKVTTEQVRDILLRQADAKREAAAGVHFNADGSTAFGGLKFSQDNFLNPRMFADYITLEQPISQLTQADIGTSAIGKFFQKPMRAVSKMLEQGTFGESINSASNTVRGKANQLWDDVRGRGMGHLTSISAETNKERITHLLAKPYLDYADARQSWCLANKTTGRAGTMAFDKMATIAYNARYAGNVAHALGDVPAEVVRAVEHMKALRDLQVTLGKRSATDVGAKANNMIEKDWEAVDHELWRMTDNNMRQKFLREFESWEEGVSAYSKATEFLGDYYKQFAKRDVIKLKIERTIAKENKKIQEINDSIPANSKQQPQELKEAKVTEEDIDKYLTDHVPSAVEHMLKGNLDTTLKGSINQLGSLGFLKERVPIDTTGVVKLPNGKEFSFDNNLRTYDMDAVVQKNITRFAGECAVKNVFGSEQGLKEFLQKAKSEMDLAVDNGYINRGKADADYNHLERGIYELRGMKPNVESMQRVGALCRILRNTAYTRNGANMGFSQLGEMGGTIAYGGTSQIARVFSPLGKLMEDCKHGKVTAETARDVTDHMFGETIESQIWSVNWGDRAIRDALTKDAIVDKALIMAGDISANLGKVTSSINFLPKMTDSMLKGMRVQTFVDSIRWAQGKTFSKGRNPFSDAKLKASHISATDALKIKQHLNTYTTTNAQGDLVKFDHAAWQEADPPSYLKWYGMIQTQAERAIVSGSRLGNKNLFKDKNCLTQMMFQFKDYNLRAINAQSMRAMTAGDLDDALATALSVVTNTAAYSVRVGAMYGALTAVGAADKAGEYAKTMFDKGTLMRVAAFRSSIIGSPITFVNDIDEAWHGRASIRTTVDRGTGSKGGQREAKDIIGDFASQLPAIKEGATYSVSAYNAFCNASASRANKRDFKSLLNLAPIPNFIPFAAYINHFVDQSDYPDKRPK